MCILFVYLNPEAENGQYKLILASNRDEFYTRPTKPALFWGKDDDFLSGIDMESSREGGTWIGVSKQGHLGVLLNILTETGPLPNKRPRGHLVTDYLIGTKDAPTYLKDLSNLGPDFNGFNLVCFNMKKNEHLHYYSSTKDSPEILPAGTYGFSNSVLEKPFQKTIYGEKKFSGIVDQFGSPKDKSSLITELWKLMSDETRCLPDEQMLMQGGASLYGDLYPQRAAVYVNSSQVNYGTRTTTLILMDQTGRCDYLEKTMREPIDGNNPIWDVQAFDFTIKDD